jgi:hypothetical protein
MEKKHQFFLTAAKILKSLKTLKFSDAKKKTTIFAQQNIKFINKNSTEQHGGS